MFSGLLIVLGAVIYTLKVPERYIKGLDYIGNSHNYFHILAILASLLAIKGSVRMYHERQLY